MALVTSDFLAAVMTGQRAIFQQALGEAQAKNQDHLVIATRMPSTTDQETYNWLGATPNMSEWTDKRKLYGLRPYHYSLVNKHYEGTIEIDRDTFEDDKLGQITPRVQGLAAAAIRHYAKLIFSALDDGETGVAYDAGYFFADTRTIGASANIDNILAGNYSDSEAEIRAGVAAAVAAMAAYQDDWGEPLGLVPDTIVCAPGMAIAINQALNPGVAGVARPEAAFVKRIITSPYIDADTDDWFFLCTTEMVKPIIFQDRKAPEFAALDDPKSSHVFLQKTFVYGVDDRFAVGFGDPRTAILMHNT